MNIPEDKYGSPFDKKARISGITLTILLHLALIFVFISTDIRPTEIIPDDMEIVLEFTEEEPKSIQAEPSSHPRSVEAQSEKDIRLVQKSDAQLVATKENLGVETTVDKDAEVEVPEPPRPKPINRRALFSSAINKDSLAPQTADRVSDKITAGHPEGNTQIGAAEGVPTAKLEGRSIMGSLPLPEYEVENAGRVVVRIMVDQYGTVTNAISGIKGTTVQDAILWNAARKAALEAKFNISSSAPIVQEGSITYIFKLK